MIVSPPTEGGFGVKLAEEVRHASSAPVQLRIQANYAGLRGGRRTGPQARRLLALAAIYDGATRTQAAAIGGVTLQASARLQ